MVLIHQTDAWLPGADVEFVRGSIEKAAGYREALQRADLVLHLAGATHESKVSEYYRVNQRGTEQLLTACRPDQAVVYMSTRCVGEQGGAYSYSKQLAEQAIKSERRPHVIIRPAEVYGTRSGEGIDSLLRIAARTRLLADFRWNPPVTYSPISVDELADFTADVVRNIRAGRTYTLCNGRAYTAEEIRQALTKRLGKRVFRVPVSVSALMMLRKLRVPTPFKGDQLRRLVMRKSSDTRQARNDYGFAPVPFTEAITSGVVAL